MVRDTYAQTGPGAPDRGLEMNTQPDNASVLATDGPEACCGRLHRIKAINSHGIFNSHVKETSEFIIEFDDGSTGTGSSSQGETISIYEDRKMSVTPRFIIDTILRDGCQDRPLSQHAFDSYLKDRMALFGRNNAFALSLAFYNAAHQGQTGLREPGRTSFPRLCLNILNGGSHAYTNPVLSDFPEYLLVSSDNDPYEVIRDFTLVQNKVGEELLLRDKVAINGNPVNKLAGSDNRACIEFLLDIVSSLKLSDKFDLMIDASAGDLFSDGRYRLSLTDGSLKSGPEFCNYWLDLIREYGLRYLEDPFHENDFGSWGSLSQLQDSCCVIGDNFYSSGTDRIREGASNRHTHGVIIKPNQAGTVTGTLEAISAARTAGQVVITSHRSISTESTFLSYLTMANKADFIKVGPLFTDYSSVIRLNELIRLSRTGHE